MSSSQLGSVAEHLRNDADPDPKASNDYVALPQGSSLIPSSGETLLVPTEHQYRADMISSKAIRESQVKKQEMSSGVDTVSVINNLRARQDVGHMDDASVQQLASVGASREQNEHSICQDTVEYISYPDIEIDLKGQHISDADSALGSMPPSSTVSVRESIFDFVEENGRTYHAYKAGKYIGPNDEIEQARLDLQHQLFVMTMENKLHLAPLTNPQNVLDIATGTGIWAIEFAKQYPSASVLGTDLSPIQPESTPPNCRFVIDDAEEDWIYSPKFDYIHGRALISCFRDPFSVVLKIFENLSPDGYFEFQDPIMPLRSIDGTLAGTHLEEFQTACMAAAEKLGRPWTNSKNYGRFMREAGFVDVVEKSYYWATNQWVKGKKQKLQALWLQNNLQDGLPAWGLSTLSRAFGWSRERIEVLLAKARMDLRDPNIHAYAECYVVYGRKAA